MEPSTNVTHMKVLIFELSIRSTNMKVIKKKITFADCFFSCSPRL